MSEESTRAVIERYVESQHTDFSMIADDAVFTMMPTGEEHAGREAISQALHYFYHVAFDATAEVKNIFAADGKAVLEADVAGRHIGEFAGIPGTNKDIRVPLCVVYDLEDDLIKRARVYFEVPVLLRQLGITG